MRISDWSSDVCSSDLSRLSLPRLRRALRKTRSCLGAAVGKSDLPTSMGPFSRRSRRETLPRLLPLMVCHVAHPHRNRLRLPTSSRPTARRPLQRERTLREQARCRQRSEEHTSELQSLMRISYAVFCLKKKKKKTNNKKTPTTRI